MPKPSTGLRWIRYEIILTIMIILCLMHIITYENITKTHNALSITNNGTISILHDEKDINVFIEKGRPIIYYTHDACSFIAVYDESYIRQSLIMLDDVEPLYDLIDHRHNWDNIFKSSDKGDIDLRSDNVNMTLHFEWVVFADGTRYLITYGIDNVNQNMFNFFNVVCYIAIILSFTMLITILYYRYHGIANTYKKVSDEVIKIIS